MEKAEGVDHLEQTSHDKAVFADGEEGKADSIDVHDEKANRLLNRKLDLRIIPLCCWIYLLNFLDRGTSRPIHSLRFPS